MLKIEFGLWNVIMQKQGLWREKVDKLGKIPEIGGFYPQILWKTQWIMGKNAVETVDYAVICVLNIHSGIFIRKWTVL